MERTPKIDDGSELPSTPAYMTEREGLDPALRDQYDALVRDYRYFAFTHYGRPFVSYKILADLARAGWRANAPAPKQRKQ